MLGIIIQARLGSTRLPKKILKSFAGTNLLFFLIEKLKQLDLPIVVATTTSEIDDELCLILEQNKVSYFRGSESDVLLRYIEAAKQFGITEIIRVCSDSPLIDLTLLGELISFWKENKSDYLSFSFNGTPTILCHYGAFAEITTLRTLDKLNSEFVNKYYHEHVTYGIYKNPEMFDIKLIELPADFQRYNDIRVTIDTQEDYENLNFLYNSIENLSNKSFSELAELILKDNSLLKKMKINIANNKKI